MPKKDDELKVSKPEESLADSKKIDLYINNQEDQEQGISIMNVFSRLKERFHIYVFVIVAALLAGLLVPTLMYTFKDKRESAVAILGLDYAEATQEKAPDGSDLDISYLKSSYVVQNALDSVTLSKKVTAEQVRANLKITGVLTDETKQQQDILNKLEEGKSTEYAKLLQEFQLKYRAQYIISIDNIFSDGKAKMILPSHDLSLLLSSITNAYNDYFVETYQDHDLPNNYLSAINEASLDYLEVIDRVSDSLDYLSTYCGDKAKLLPNYRTKDGVSFADLKKTIDTVRNTDVNQYAAFIYEKNVYKNKTVLKAYYEAQQEAASLEKNEVEGKIANYTAAINGYQNGKIVVNTPDGGHIDVPHTEEEYNKLVLELVSLNERKSALAEKISTLTDRIAKLDGAPATDAQKQEADAYVAKALADSRRIYELVNKSSQELFDSNAYKSVYMHAVTTTDNERFSDNIKLFLIGAGAGLAVGVILWVADAFILEFRAVRKANEEREAE